MLSSLHILLAACALAAAVPAAAPAAAYCSKSPYNIILVLSTYPPAQSFCQARFPVVPATVKTAVTTTLGVMGAAARDLSQRTPPPGAHLVKDAVTCKGNCAAWAGLSKVGGSLVSSACGCIQTKPTTTVTTTVTSTPPAVSSTPSTPPPTPTTPSAPCPAAIAPAVCTSARVPQGGFSKAYFPYDAQRGRLPDLDPSFTFTGVKGQAFPCSNDPDTEIQQCANAALADGTTPDAIVVYSNPSDVTFRCGRIAAGGDVTFKEKAEYCPAIQAAYGYNR